MGEQKRKWGDRRDGVWINRTDSMHLFMPYLYPNRTDAEAFMQEEIDAAPIKEYIAKKNSAGPEDKYTVFHAVIAALMKTVALRPHLNRFYKGGRLYQRNGLSLAFVAKKKFAEGSEESLLFFRSGPEDTIDSLHDRIYEKLNRIRKKGENDATTDIIGVLCRLPRPLIALVVRILRVLEYFGRVPASMIREDPHFATVWLTNLGSIKLNANYHHLNNWGTNGIFVVVGEMHEKVVPDGRGGVCVREVLPVSITLDERITDGYYCAGSIRLFKHLMANPELLDTPAGKAVEYE